MSTAVLAVVIHWEEAGGVSVVWLRLTVNTLLILLFCGYIVKKDLPLSGLPIIGKYFR